MQHLSIEGHCMQRRQSQGVECFLHVQCPTAVRGQPCGAKSKRMQLYIQRGKPPLN